MCSLIFASSFSLLQYVVLVEVDEENLALHRVTYLEKGGVLGSFNAAPRFAMDEA